MPRRILPAAVAAIALGLPATAQTESWDYSGFEEIEASAGLRVEFETAETYSVRAEFEKGDRSDVEVDLDGDTLELRRKGGWNRANRVKATFYVTAPSLEAIEVSSGVSMRAVGIDADDFEIDASSGASLRVTGGCAELEIDASSGASVDAAELECVDVDVDASSGSSVRAHATGEIRADASSGAGVRVSGGGQAMDIDSSSGASVDIEPREL